MKSDSKEEKDFSYIKNKKRIYKYLDLEGGIIMLLNHTIRLSNVARLNDPFDCYEGLIDYSLNEYWERQVRDKFAKEFIQPSHISKKECEKTLASAIEIMRNIDAERTNKFENYYVFSGTIDPLNNIMWSHYAKQHTGICIGINTIKLMDYLFKKYDSIVSAKVNYCNKFIPIPLYEEKKENDPFLYHIISTKFSGWRYEKEIRIGYIDTSFYDSPVHHYKPQKYMDIEIPSEFIETIYIGHLLDEEDPNLKKMIDIVKEKYPHMKIYNMDIKKGTFKMYTTLLKV